MGRFILLLGCVVVMIHCAHLTSKKEIQGAQYNLTQSKEYAIYSSLSYCDKPCVQKWNCKGSKQVPLVDPVYLYDNLTQVAGFIGYKPDTQSIILSFRGSSNKPNWEQDFNIEMVPYNRCKDCYIHLGFLFDFSVLSLKIYQQIQKIKSKYIVKQVLTTGHSLGGALALVAGMEIKMNYGNQFRVDVHTFGQPRVCNTNLAQFMKSKLNSIFRVIHYQDLVPHVPFEWLKYTHAGNQVFFSEDMQTYKVCNDSGEDPSCSNQFYPVYNPKDHDLYFIPIDNKSNCKVTL